MVYLFFAFAVFVVIVAFASREMMKIFVFGMCILAATSGLISIGYEFFRRM